MTKQEFENLTEMIVTDSGYEIINTVYTFHPSIDEVKGKEQIAKLFTDFGYTVILNMLPTAEKARKLESDIRSTENQLTSLRQQLKELKVTEF